MSTADRSGAEEIAQFLADHQQDHVFGLTGSNSVSIYHALAESPTQYVQSIHEGAAIAMADGYARVRGEATCLTYMLPGTANMVANLYNAWRDESPVLLLMSDQGSTAKNGFAGVCEGDLVSTVAPYTKLARTVPASSSMRVWLERGYRQTIAAATGPVALSVPTDVLEGAAMPAAPPRAIHRAETAPGDCTAVTTALRGARRPLIVAGGQVQRTGGSDLLTELAEEFDLPVAFEPGFNDRLSIAPWDRHFCGQLGQGSTAERLAEQADVVIIIGAKFFSEDHGGSGRPWFPSARFVAHINADPAKLDDTYSADWSCACSPREFLRLLTEQLRALPVDHDIRETRREQLDAISSDPTDPTDPVAVAGAALHDALERGWVVDESTMSSTRLINAFGSGDHSRYTTTSGGSLGWGPAAACGVALASGLPTTCTLGDGALKFGLHGLWTARAYNLPITFFVLDNRAYGSTEFFEDAYLIRTGKNRQPSYLGSDFSNFPGSSADLLEGFGIPTTSVPFDADVRGAVTKAWDHSDSGPDKGPHAVVVELPPGSTAPASLMAQYAR